MLNKSFDFDLYNTLYISIKQKQDKTCLHGESHILRDIFHILQYRKPIVQYINNNYCHIVITIYFVNSSAPEFFTCFI